MAGSVKSIAWKGWQCQVCSIYLVKVCFVLPLLSIKQQTPNSAFHSQVWRFASQPVGHRNFTILVAGNQYNSSTPWPHENTTGLPIFFLSNCAKINDSTSTWIYVSIVGYNTNFRGRLRYFNLYYRISVSLNGYRGAGKNCSETVMVELLARI
jgi:hypothetical protein